MLVNIKKIIANQQGLTVVELVVTIAIIGLMMLPTIAVVSYFYGGAVKNNLQARLAVESQNVLRSVVEELRTGSGIRASNSITDPNAPTGGWTTSNSSLVLIVSSPVTDNGNNYIIDSSTGDPYQNEIVYFATGGKLYKRYLANPSATGNRFKTSCPAISSSASCPADAILSNHFKDMDFIFYDQDDVTTTTLANARSIDLTVEMEQKTFGLTLVFDNNIRITLRNST